MAMAYVTARGKNKKSKESVRKDNKNNQANKLLSAMMKESSKNKTFEQKDFENKHKMALAAAEQRLQIKAKESNEKLLQANGPSTQEVLLQALSNMKIFIPSNERCLFVGCNQIKSEATKQCGKCRIARYCSLECQRSDWSAIHKTACCKTDSLIQVGSSVAIRPIESHWKKFEVLYRKCNPPSNEIHGLVTSVSPIKIEIFDSNLIASGQFLEEVNFDDIVVTQWNLEEERSSETQKKKHIADTERIKIRRELDKIEDQEEKKQKKIKQREMLRNLLIEKKKAEMAALLNKEVSTNVDWSLFTEEIDEELLAMENNDENNDEINETEL